MPVYSETIENDKIVNKLKNKYHNILIIGCGSCMNESLSYKYDTPIFEDTTTEFPYSTNKELERLTNILLDNGFNVECKIILPHSKLLCMRDNQNGENDFFLKKPDVILALSCPAGLFGIRTSIKNIPIIRITEQHGFLSYLYKEQNKQRWINKDLSIVMK